MLRARTYKIEDLQEKLLDKYSKASHIPKSALVRKGIDLLFTVMKEDVISAEFRNEVDELLSEDKELLKRLAK